MSSHVKVIGYRDLKKQSGSFIINTTSHSDTWSKAFSPFLLSPVHLYDGFVSKNVENDAFVLSMLLQFPNLRSKFLD